MSALVITLSLAPNSQKRRASSAPSVLTEQMEENQQALNSYSHVTLNELVNLSVSRENRV